MIGSTLEKATPSCPAKNALLPDGWGGSQIGDIAVVTDYVANGSFASLRENVKYLKEPGYAVLIRTTDHNKGWNGDYVYVDKHAYEFLAKSVVKPGDIVVSNVGEPGQVFRAPDLKMPMTLGPNSILLKPIGDEIEKGFLEYFLKSPYGQQLIHGITSATTQRKFNKTEFRKLKIPIAPSAEQKRIVAKVEELLARVNAVRERLAKVQEIMKQFRQSVLAAAFLGKLTEDWRVDHSNVVDGAKLLTKLLAERRRLWEHDQLSILHSAGTARKAAKCKKRYKPPVSPVFPKLDALPEGWAWVTLDQCTTRITDGEHLTPERSDHGIPLLSARNVLDGALSLEKLDYIPDCIYEKLAQRLKVQAGDVLLSCSGTVGRSCVAPSGFKFALVRSVAVLKPMLDMGHFLSLTLRSPSMQDQIAEKKTQTAQSNIFQGKIRTLELPLPTLPEQREIVVRVEALFKLADTIERRVAAAGEMAEKLTQAILAKAFRGELVPQDPADEPASLLLERIRAARGLRPMRGRRIAGLKQKG